MKKINVLFCLLLVISFDYNLQSGPRSRIASPLVVSYYQQAQDAGYRILKAGGNAFDAFVTVTAVENVLSSGEVTLAGLLSTLIYHAKFDRVIYLDGGFNSVSDREGTPDPEKPEPGKWIMVPGVIAGLEAISKRYGRLALSELLEPAIQIARNGFIIDELHAKRIKAGAEKLRSTDYGRRTYFPGGTQLKPGDILKQPELANFLKAVARQGAAYMYEGEWALRCMETVRKQGGIMTRQDLSAYQTIWTEPWKINYRGFDIFASSGHTMFGVWTLLALKTLEHTGIRSKGHYATSADALEILVRISREVQTKKWIRDHRYLNDRKYVNSKLTQNNTSTIWKRIKGRITAEYENRKAGHHTMSSIVADKEGNVVTGKHSINSELWGAGQFVQGVLLNSSGDNYGRFTGAGKRRTQGAPNFLVFKEGILKYALGTYSSSNPQAAFQFLVNLLDYGLPPVQAVDLPRFGSFPYNEKDWTVDFSKNWLDPRIDSKIVGELKKRGLFFSQESPKLGKGCIAEFHLNGKTSSGYDKIN